jgi:ABC-type phosphate transport system substrate-binding protein
MQTRPMPAHSMARHAFRHASRARPHTRPVLRCIQTAGWLLWAVTAGAQARSTTAPYRVIVNASNPVTTLSRDDLSRLFLKKTTRWPSGGQVVPVDQGEDSPLRATFTRDIHKRDLDSVRSYWQQVIFEGRGLPPTEKASDGEVEAFVAANPSAIGYVSAGRTLPETVKAIEVASP